MWILFSITLFLSLWATWRVKSVYHENNMDPVASGLTGMQVASEILRRNGISDVEIVSQEGLLGDHYDPTQKRLVLSEENYHGCTAAALGVAAHECGHAIQDAHGYAPLKWRMATVGITTFANYLVMLLPLVGITTGLLAPKTAAVIISAAWGVMMLFNLITLPVEFDASRRAVESLKNYRMISSGKEADGVREVLDAAAWTYVAAFITSLLYFLWHLLPLLMGGRSRN